MVTLCTVLRVWWHCIHAQHMLHRTSRFMEAMHKTPMHICHLPSHDACVASGVAAARSAKFHVAKVAEPKLSASAQKSSLNWIMGLQSCWIQDRCSANSCELLGELVNSANSRHWAVLPSLYSDDAPTTREQRTDDARTDDALADHQGSIFKRFNSTVKVVLNK